MPTDELNYVWISSTYYANDNSMHSYIIYAYNLNAFIYIFVLYLEKWALCTHDLLSFKNVAIRPMIVFCNYPHSSFNSKKKKQIKVPEFRT